jgi:hypothetical protein
MKKILFIVALSCFMFGAHAQKNKRIPRVFTVENTGAECARPVLPEFDALPVVRELPDPLEWSDGSGRVQSFQDWTRRRAEIAAEIQHYEIGEKPVVNKEQISARMNGDTLIVDVTVNGNTITLSAVINYPKTGRAPYPLLIGASHISLPGEVLVNRPLALMTYNERQVNGYSQFKGNTDRTTYPFVHLYPHLIDNGAYSEWAWGFSRLIDGLQMLGSKKTKIDMKRIGVTGCSYAGKMALFCGAFDERVALTIAQEPGGGGAASWRVSHTLEGVEDLDKTDYHWFKESLKEQFHDDNVYRLPYDHHELCAMVCPRALLLLGNPDYKWLADESMLASYEAARNVWDFFGVGNRIDCSIVAGHPHCQVPESQFDIIGHFLDEFLIIK